MITVQYFDGTDAEAFVLSVKLNTTSGLPLSAEDRVMAASRIIASHPHWSDRTIASVTGTSARTVSSLRGRSTAAGQQLNTRTGRDGKVRPLRSAAGRRRAKAVLDEQPDASLRQIAREAGIALGTARDVRERVRRGEDPVPPQQRATQPQVPEQRRKPAGPTQVTSAGVETGATRMLRNDPSLRFTEAGRSLLRLLEAHTLSANEWDRLALGVPPHCADTVADTARECAEAWQYFARQVEGRAGYEHGKAQ